MEELNQPPPDDSRAAQARRTRSRALIIPREHGAWGLLLVPLLSGAAVGWASGHRAVPLLLFAVSVVALFWMRTPLESLLGTAPMSAHSPAEWRLALVATIALGGISMVCLAVLMWGANNRGLLWLGGIGAATFVLQSLLKNLGRSMRMPAQLVGALGLTSTAAAAYYVAAGSLDRSAIGLWAANWFFAGNQIHYVHLRIHGARAARADKFVQGRWFFIAQIALISLLAWPGFEKVAPRWAAAAFVPMLARGFYWFVRKPTPLQIKQLGWSEMAQGVVFGALLTTAYISSS